VEMTGTDEASTTVVLSESISYVMMVEVTAAVARAPDARSI